MFWAIQIRLMSDEDLMQKISCWQGSADAHTPGTEENRHWRKLKDEARKRGLTITTHSMVMPSHVKGRLSK